MQSCPTTRVFILTRPDAPKISAKICVRESGFHVKIVPDPQGARGMVHHTVERCINNPNSLFDNYEMTITRLIFEFYLRHFYLWHFHF